MNEVWYAWVAINTQTQMVDGVCVFEDEVRQSMRDFFNEFSGDDYIIKRVDGEKARNLWNRKWTED